MKIEDSGRLPDGSGWAIGTMPLPPDHWLVAMHPNESPAPFRMGTGPTRDEWAEKILAAARYAIRTATMNGKEANFDPDAMVQNFVVGMLGYWTHDGESHTCFTLRGDLDRIARAHAERAYTNTGEDEPLDVVIRRALVEFGEACARTIEETGYGGGYTEAFKAKAVAAIRSALGREAPK